VNQKIKVKMARTNPSLVVIRRIIKNVVVALFSLRKKPLIMNQAPRKGVLRYVVSVEGVEEAGAEAEDAESADRSLVKRKPTIQMMYHWFNSEDHQDRIKGKE
jgi:hypothetical protein